MATRDALGDKRTVNLVVRFLLDNDGALVRGEVVDAWGNSRGRFSEWERLMPVIRHVVEEGEAAGGEP
jgi:hypothetical protein